MSGGPVGAIGRNVARELETAMAAADGWDFFEKEFLPAAVADSFRPEEKIMRALARFAATHDGKAAMEWLMALTLEAPYPRTGGSLEHTALAAALHQGRAGVGHVVKKALREGARLIEGDRNENPV